MMTRLAALSVVLVLSPLLDFSKATRAYAPRRFIPFLVLTSAQLIPGLPGLLPLPFPSIYRFLLYWACLSSFSALVAYYCAFASVLSIITLPSYFYSNLCLYVCACECSEDRYGSFSRPAARQVFSLKPLSATLYRSGLGYLPLLSHRQSYLGLSILDKLYSS